MIASFFGFSENPFQLTPDPRFLFLTNSHQEALASMIYAIKERKGFISISGEVGTGKTTLLRHLLNILEPRIKTVFIYQTLLSFEELLKDILLELELPLGDQSKTFLIRQLNDYLIQKLARDETVAIAIDEAQNLSEEVLEGLRLLSNLETERSKLLQIVLVGQPELEEKLNSEDLRQLKQRIGIRRQIKPLTEEESRQYIAHRLSKVGSSIEKVFTPEAVSLICRTARGIPRIINILCDNALLIGYALRKKKIDDKIVTEVLSDMGELPRERGIDRELRDRTQAAGKSLQSMTDDHSPAAHGMNENVVNRLTKDPEGFNGDQERERSFVKTPRGFSRYQRPIVVACGVLSLILVGFIARGYWTNSQKRLEPPPPMALAAKVDSPVQPKQENRIKGVVAVEKGETLSSLAQRYYGLSNYTIIDHILVSNDDITNPHRIWEHQKITLPEITDDALIVRWRNGTHGIWLGTFLRPEQAEYLNSGPSLEGKEWTILSRKVSSNETWYRAVVGGFETREECLKSIEALRMEGFLPAFGESSFTR